MPSLFFFFFSSRRRHTRYIGDWSSDVCSSDLLTLCLLILVNQFGFGIITPVLPLYADSFGLGPSLIGVVIGIYGTARFLVNVPAGRLAEARGRRPRSEERRVGKEGGSRGPEAD